MGRSVSNLSNASVVLYFHHDEDTDWDMTIEDIQETVKSAYPEFKNVNKEWEDNEVKFILRSPSIEIAISEYCGLVSLSLRPVADPDEEGYIEIVNYIQLNATKILPYWNELRKVAIFSNGEGLFEFIEEEE